MRKKRKNSGFTLVECIVAMAVLAIMALGLMMILGVTVRQRNQNTQIERNVDEQVDKLYAGNEAVTVTAEDIELIPGVAISGVNKVYFDDPNSDFQVGKLQLGGAVTATTPADTTTPAATTPAQTTTEPPKNTPSAFYKVYGAVSLTNPEVIYVSQQSATDNGNNTHTVTWRIIFHIDTSKYDLNKDTNIRTLKVVFPPTSKVLAYTPNAGEQAVRFGSNVVRITPGYSADAQIDIEFIIPSDDYKSTLIQDHFGSANPAMYNFTD